MILFWSWSFGPPNVEQWWSLLLPTARNCWWPWVTNAEATECYSRNTATFFFFHIFSRPYFMFDALEIWRGDSLAAGELSHLRLVRITCVWWSSSLWDPTTTPLGLDLGTWVQGRAWGVRGEIGEKNTRQHDPMLKTFRLGHGDGRGLGVLGTIAGSSCMQHTSGDNKLQLSYIPPQKEYKSSMSLASYKRTSQPATSEQSYQLQANPCLILEGGQLKYTQIPFLLGRIFQLADCGS